MTKVHFVPQGYEEHRILAGITLSGAEKVIIIRNTEIRLADLEKEVQIRINNITNTIKNEKLSYFFVKDVFSKEYTVNFFDFIDALRKIEEWVLAELSQRNQVSVNISTGNSIVNCALFCVAMKFGLPTYYIIPEYYEDTPVSEFSAERLAKGVRERVTLPKITLEYLHDIDFEIIKALTNMGGKAESMTSLVLQMRPDLENLKGKQRRELVHRERMRVVKNIEQLRTLGYIEVHLKGRKKEIVLSDLGEEILRYKS